MKYNEAHEIIVSNFSNLYNDEEKSLLESLLNQSIGIRTKAILTDLLTNDFKTENIGYMLSMVLGNSHIVLYKREVINLAKCLVSYINDRDTPIEFKQTKTGIKCYLSAMPDTKQLELLNSKNMGIFTVRDNGKYKSLIVGTPTNIKDFLHYGECPIKQWFAL